MSDNESGTPKQGGEQKGRKEKKGTVKKSPAGKGNLFKRWKESSENRMGNDISSEVKIANSNGEREGGDDNRWHINEGS
jgi:hypothetical protein